MGWGEEMRKGIGERVEGGEEVRIDCRIEVENGPRREHWRARGG